MDLEYPLELVDKSQNTYSCYIYSRRTDLMWTVGNDEDRSVLYSSYDTDKQCLAGEGKV